MNVAVDKREYKRLGEAKKIINSLSYAEIASIVEEHLGYEWDEESGEWIAYSEDHNWDYPQLDAMEMFS